MKFSRLPSLPLRTRGLSKFIVQAVALGDRLTPRPRYLCSLTRKKSYSHGRSCRHPDEAGGATLSYQNTYWCLFFFSLLSFSNRVHEILDCQPLCSQNIYRTGWAGRICRRAENPSTCTSRMFQCGTVAQQIREARGRCRYSPILALARRLWISVQEVTVP